MEDINMKTIDFNIIKKAVNGDLNNVEARAFEEWLSASIENRDYFNKMSNFYKSQNKPDINVNDEFLKFKSFHKRRLRLTFFKYAAVVSIIIASSLILIKHSQNVKENQIVIGSPKAILYTDNGNNFELTDETNKNLKANNISITQESGVINYSSQDTTAKPHKHRLSIPHGGEFQLILSDGTHVYINSESTLDYTSTFTNEIREVWLTGEAYFNVAHSTVPFVVHTNDMDVTVLGTEFNIRSYKDENVVHTTLVNGSVKVHAQDSTFTIKPGEQALLVNGDQLIHQCVDISKYVAWKDGNVAFENEELQSIMGKLSKWYNIDVTYSDEILKTMRFTGTIYRYGDIQELLVKFEKTNSVLFTINGNKINITHPL